MMNVLKSKQITREVSVRPLIREDLLVLDGIVVYTARIVVPTMMRKEVLRALHGNERGKVCFGRESAPTSKVLVRVTALLLRGSSSVASR